MLIFQVWLLLSLVFMLTTLISFRKSLGKEKYNNFIQDIDLQDVLAFVFTTIIFPINIFMTITNIDKNNAIKSYFIKMLEWK